MDETNDDYEYQVGLLERGITIEYDEFGWEFYLAGYDVQFPQDSARVRGIKRLLDDGWGRQVVLSHDLCLKMMRTRYGPAAVERSSQPSRLKGRSYWLI